MNHLTVLRVLCVVSIGFESRAADFTNRAKEYMDSVTKTQNFSGAVLVAHQGRVLFKRASGFANVEWSVANTTETKFEIGSLTKQFTATAILHLVELEKLRLDAPISNYIPDLPQTWFHIRIHQLLTHTSGIPNTAKLSDYSQGLHHAYTPQELIALVRNRPLEYQPGTKWKYSNTDY